MSRPSPDTCPICGSAISALFRPFCSRRCADLDLARWLKGGYAIPAFEPPDDEADAAPGPADEGE